MATNTIPQASAARQVGDRVKWRITMSPPADVSGWALALEVCEYNPPAPWPPAAAVENAALGIFSFTFDTAGWPDDTYHFRAKRLGPDPGVVSHLWLTLNKC